MSRYLKFCNATVLFILVLNVTGLSIDEKWLNYLTTHIKIKMGVSETVLIVSEDLKIQDNPISSIIARIQHEIPSQVISLSNNYNTRKAPIQGLLDKNLKTLFIVIQSTNNNLQNSENADTLQFLDQLFTYRVRPKCLMIAIPERGKPILSYEKLLQYMWSNYFLDFTILEVVDKTENSLHRKHRVIKWLHHFNPFTGIYTRQKYTKKTKLFPNKLLDLKGFEMKVGSFHYPPNAYVKRNSSGYPVEIYGPDAIVAKALSRKMNFRLSELPSQFEYYGNSDCHNASKRTGFAYLISKNKIRFITNQSGKSANCEEQSITSRSSGSFPICVLIPILTEKSEGVSITTKWIYFVSLVVMIWIITICLNFDKDFWTWFDILRQTLGFSLPSEPSKLSERIVFVSILLAFTIFSSNIFALLTDTKLTKKSDVPIDTLEELNSTNLIPMMLTNILSNMRVLNDPVLDALASKSKVIVNNEECIDMLLQRKNVACILRKSSALLALTEQQNTRNNTQMRMMKECVFPGIKTIHFEPKSPFISEVDVLLQRMIHSGLIYQWEKQFSPFEIKSNRWEEEEGEEIVSILIPLIFFITFGCSLSVLVFFGELLVKYLEKRIYGCVAFFSRGSVFF